MRPADVLSHRSRAYQQLLAGHDDPPDEALLALMAQEPTLLRRPLVARGNRVVIGFDQAGLTDLIAATS